MLATRAITDVWTALMAIATFIALTRFKVSELWLIGAAGFGGARDQCLGIGLPESSPVGLRSRKAKRPFTSTWTVPSEYRRGAW